MSKSMDKRIAAQSKPERITQEQSVQVAEWIGMKKDGQMVEPHYWWHCGFINDKSKWKLLRAKDYLKDWLFSAEGQEALMDKLEHGFYWHPKKGQFNIMKSDGNISSGFAPTRQHALLLAVLGMLSPSNLCK